MEIVSASEGEMPSGLSREEAVTFDTALKLARGRGPLDEESWVNVRAELGLEGAAALAALVAGYVYTCVVHNMGAVDAPTNVDV